MTPIIEEVARWLREAGKKEEVQRLRSGASIHDARTEGERWYLRAAQVEAMGWRPISEAPRDGTLIDMWEDDTKERLPDCMWVNGAWHQFRHPSEWMKIMFGTLTHFIPIPKPPVKK